jgi:hypothetical protein
MNLGIFLDMLWTDESSRAHFLMAHEQEHHLLNEASTDAGLSGVMYPIGEVGSREDWMRQHAQIHNTLADNAGLDRSPDLEEWNLEDAEQFRDWQLNHLADHDRLAGAYGVLT